jgi:hypothetical protein
MGNNNISLRIIMGLKLTYTKSGVTYYDSYHRITFGARDKAKKELLLVVKIYVSKAYADANPGDPFDHELIHVVPADFDAFFATMSYDDGDLYPEKQGYEFLKTIDPQAEGSNYPYCRFDYTEATDVLE